MQHADHLDSIFNRSVEDDVVTNRKTSQILCKVRSLTSEFWHSGQHLAFLVDCIEPTICGRRILFCDVKRNLDQIEMGFARAQDKRLHLALLLNRRETSSFNT